MGGSDRGSGPPEGHRRDGDRRGCEWISAALRIKDPKKGEALVRVQALRSAGSLDPPEVVGSNDS